MIYNLGTGYISAREGWLVVPVVDGRAIDAMEKALVDVAACELVDGAVGRSDVDVVEDDVRAGRITVK